MVSNLQLLFKSRFYSIMSDGILIIELHVHEDEITTDQTHHANPH